MKTLPHFRDVRDLLALIDGSRTPGQATSAPETSAEMPPDGFVDCRGVLHLWSEED
ncbi:MAG: hypothetical protein ACXVWW_04075 [Nocardioides sp.]